MKRLRAVEWNKHRDTIHEAADAIEELTAGIDAYLHFLRRSLDVGPNTANPSREAKALNNLRNLLSKYACYGHN